MGVTNIKFSILFLFYLTTLGVFSQETKLHGKITTLKGVAVEKAEISVRNKGQVTFSDQLGHFTIDCELKDRLIVKATGFDTKTIKVRNIKDTMNIELVLVDDEGPIELAAAAGHLSGNNLALAQKYYEEKDNYGFGYTNMIDLIKGKFPQIGFVNNEFIVRGYNSLNNINSIRSKNGAVIVVNGVVSDIGVLQSIIVSNVKDIRILTGSDATMYGTGSGNGVIAIRLK